VKNKIILLVLIILLIISQANASEYYADIIFQINENGETIISGTTNHPQLETKTTQELTTKNGPKWIFEINITDTFSEYVYEIILPTGTEIEKIETNSNYRIKTTNEQITIIGTGNEKPINVKVNYIINGNKTGINFMDTLILIIGIIIVIFGIYYIIKNKKNSTKQNNNKITYDKDALTERQLKIMELLEKNDGKITQSELQKTLNYPKAALSRNLNSLEKKDIISKERKGMTMLVKIKEKNQKD